MLSLYQLANNMSSQYRHTPVDSQERAARQWLVRAAAKHPGGRRKLGLDVQQRLHLHTQQHCAVSMVTCDKPGTDSND